MLDLDATGTTETAGTTERAAGTTRLRSVRARTTLVATAAVALVLTAAVAGLTFAVKRALTDQVRAQGATEIEAVIERLQAGAGPSEALEPGIAERSGVTGVPTYVAIFDNEGRPVAGAGFFFDLPGAGEVVEAEWEGSIGDEPRLVSIGSNFAIAQRSIEIDDQILLVVAVSPLGEVVNSTNTLIDQARVGIPLLILVVGLITWLATGRILQPIETIRTEVEAMSSQSRIRRVAVPGTGDEVSRLAETMNGMLARLDEASMRQREFVSDASHELRSPVASIRAALEVALAHPTASTWPDVANDVLSETSRLERIIDDLLLLARFDEGAVPPTSIVDIGHLIEQMTIGVDVVHGVDVETRVVDGLLVRGNQNGLVSAVRNLVDNAARHANTKISVGAAARGDTIVITVDDDGPGIPAPDRERVFERFTRLDHPRSRADGGVGLGLAVVNRVVRHHHGFVTVSQAPAGGARFEVVLPSAP